MADMLSPGLGVEICEFSGPAMEEIQSVRYRVFSLEQGVDPELDADGQDRSAIHVLARDNDLPVGTGRLLKDGHIGRIAVLRSHRGMGVGQRIVTTLVSLARDRGDQRVFLGAQVHARGFYEQMGFSPFGRHYEEAGIRHLHMEKILIS